MNLPLHHSDGSSLCDGEHITLFLSGGIVFNTIYRPDQGPNMYMFPTGDNGLIYVDPERIMKIIPYEGDPITDWETFFRPNDITPNPDELAMLWLMFRHSTITKETKMNLSGWTPVGYLDVDSGCMTLGDPCYTMDGEDRSLYYRVTGLDKTGDNALYCLLDGGKKKPVDDLNHANLTMGSHRPGGSESQFVTVQAGCGDGSYPVFVELDKTSGRVAALMVRFIDEEDS